MSSRSNSRTRRRQCIEHPTIAIVQPLLASAFNNPVRRAKGNRPRPNSVKVRPLFSSSHRSRSNRQQICRDTFVSVKGNAGALRFTKYSLNMRMKGYMATPSRLESETPDPKVEHAARS
jgi:hypothetical protein